MKSTALIVFVTVIAVISACSSRMTYINQSHSAKNDSAYHTQ